MILKNIASLIDTSRMMLLGHRTSLSRDLAIASQDRPLKQKEERRREIFISVSQISEHAADPCRKDGCLAAIAHCHALRNFIMAVMATPLFITQVMRMGDTVVPCLDPRA